MQSKEEIEKALNNLWNSLDDELFNLTYSQEEMQEDLRIVLNEYNYLDVMNDRKEQKIEQLESGKQKLIEKLEEDVKIFGNYEQRKQMCREQLFENDSKWFYAKEILNMIK